MESDGRYSDIVSENPLAQQENAFGGFEPLEAVNDQTGSLIQDPLGRSESAT